MRLGDANEDGAFDVGDLERVLELITEPQSLPDPTHVNVALPCEGDVDMEDMRRLRAAVAGQEVGVEMESQCHPGIMIGHLYQPKAKKQKSTPITLDDKFARIATVLPEFAGLYVGDEELVIMLTDTSQEVAAAAEWLVGAHFPDRFDDMPIELKQARYSFEQLSEWRVAAREILFLEPVYSVDLNEVGNQVVIGIENIADAWTIHQELLTFYGGTIPDDAIRYEQEELPVDLDFINDELRVQTRPLQGGVQTASGGTCTLGIVAIRNGQVGFLTNSHCTANRGVTDGTAFGQPNTANQIGVETWDSPAWSQGCPSGLCTWADAAFVQLNPGITAYRGRLKQDPAVSGPYKTGFVNAEEFFPVWGENLHKVGCTTGHTFGIVDKTCVDMTTNWTKLCQFRVSGAMSGGGDSGSPVFKPQNPGGTALTFYGLLHAGLQGGGSNFWFSSMASIDAMMGGINTLNIDSPPTVTITAPIHASEVGPGILPQTTLIADFFDLENGLGCENCEVKWTWPGGSQTVPVTTGTTAPLTVWLNLSAGQTGWIYAEAKDGGGNKVNDAVYVVASNSAPTVQIIKPLNFEQIVAGWSYMLQGTSFDAEVFGPLPCNKLTWTSIGMSGGSSIGCTPVVTFPTPGFYNLTLTGVDPNNESGYATRAVQIVAPPTNGPPVILIVKPTPHAIVHPGQPVQMIGYGNDPDGKSPIVYEWVLIEGQNQQSLGTTQANTGANTPPVYWTPQHDAGWCSPKPVKIELRATDADNETQSTDVDVHIHHNPC